MTQQTTPEISERGFAAMPTLAGLYGETIRVHESSLATHDALWVDIRQDGDADRTGTEATAHLDMPTALTLTDQINALAARRGWLLELPPAPSITWRTVIAVFRAHGWAWRGHAGPARTAHPLGDDGRPDRRAGSITITRYRPRTGPRQAPRLWRVTLHAPGLIADTVDLIDPSPATVLEYAARLGLIRAPALTDPAAREAVWREVASWVRGHCAHVMGLPVCGDCIALAGDIEAHATTIGKDADQ